MKICTKKSCKHKGELQPTGNFYKQIRNKDGFASTCKDCLQETRDFHEAKRKQNKKDFYAVFIG